MSQESAKDKSESDKIIYKFLEKIGSKEPSHQNQITDETKNDENTDDYLFERKASIEDFLNHLDKNLEIVSNEDTHRALEVDELFNKRDISADNSDYSFIIFENGSDIGISEKDSATASLPAIFHKLEQGVMQIIQNDACKSAADCIRNKLYYSKNLLNPLKIYEDLKCQSSSTQSHVKQLYTSVKSSCQTNMDRISRQSLYSQSTNLLTSIVNRDTLSNIASYLPKFNKQQ
jgi:hypothetical protein